MMTCCSTHTHTHTTHIKFDISYPRLEFPISTVFPNSQLQRRYCRGQAFRLVRFALQLANQGQ